MSKNMAKKFNPVDPQPNFPVREVETMKYWVESGVVEDYLARNDKSDKRFSFIDGPITANGPMGVHHAWGRTYKDVWQRYYNMKGFKQRFQNGFDGQGLWVEVTVEKELGLKNKKEIEALGIDKFVELCMESVRKFAGIQTEQSKRLGMFMDWPNSYYTMSAENNYMIWTFLKEVEKRGWLYKGRDSVPWCPRCGTAISQHEILGEEYQEITHQSVYVKYPLVSNPGEYLLVWTTTPWTLPANVAIAVSSDISYAKVRQNGEILYLAEDLLKVLEPGYEVLEVMPGKKLVGLQYKGLYDYLVSVSKQLADYKHQVVLANDLVTSVEGTGLVHIAPGAGEEDFKLSQLEKLPVVEVIGEAAEYLAEFGELSGQSAKDNPDLIISDIKKKGFLYKVEAYRHRYPICWRCKTELVWRVVDEWYISMRELRKEIAKNVREINWLPTFGLERELDWLKNMQDWLISKKRYWGLALPIWECGKCGHYEVMGDEKELEERAVKGWDSFAGHTPHRPWVDKVKIICRKCGSEVSRIKDVGNVWLDAGIVPFSTLNYKSDPDYFRQWYPADFITESFPGQFKNWFYSLLVMATVLENKPPFKTVLGYATMMAEDGTEMHKSKGNLIVFDDAAEKVGADVMRWAFIRHNPENNINFGYATTDIVRKNFFLILHNVYKFFIDYATLDKYDPKEHAPSPHLLDRWITSRMNETLEAVDAAMVKYDPLRVGEAVEALVQDLSTWWLRRSRDRMGPLVRDTADKKYAFDTFYQVLTTLTKTLAPFTPFITEDIYRNLTGSRSVHLEDWPTSGEIDRQLVSDMTSARLVAQSAHGLRKVKGFKLRQPLSSLSYSLPQKLPSDIEDLIATEVNVKKVQFAKTAGQNLLVELDFELTPELKLEGEARDLIRQIQDERKRLNLDRKTPIVVTLPHVPAGWADEIARSVVAKKVIPGKEFGVEEVQSAVSRGVRSKKDR